MADLNFQINVQGNAGEAIGSLKKQLREAQAEVGALSDKFGATSKQAIEAAKRASDLKDRIGDAKALTDAFNPDAKFKALTASLSGVAGGFAAVQGAIGLFGGEAKEVEKAILKVQSALALSQGLQSIGESIDSFKQLGAVIKSSTAFIKLNEVATKGAAIATRFFGAAVDTTAVSFKALKVAIASTGIGLLVVAIGFLVEKLMSLGNASEEAAEKQKQLNEQIANTAKESIKANEKFIDSDIKLKIARAKLRGASEKELFDIEQQGIKDKIRIRQENYEKALKTDKDLASDIAQQNADAQDQLLLNELEFKRKQNELAKAERIKRLEDEKKAEEDYQRWSKDARDKRKADLEKDQEEIDKENADKKEQEQKDEEDFLERVAKRGEISLDIATKTADATNEINKQQYLNERAIIDARIAAQNEFAFAVASTFGNLSNVFEKGTAASKAAGLAEIAIQSGVGFANGLRIAQESAKGTGPAAAFAFPIFYATQVAAVLAAVGKAKSILSTVKGSSGSSANISAPSITSASPLSPQLPQAQLTQLNSASINAIGNQAIKAYVVETDVTSNQQRVKAIQQRARFD
jgi:hypothetical protein